MALKVSAVLSAWKEFNLHQTQQEIDDTATDVTAKQDESEVSRKKLVEQFKEFKKNTPDEVRKQVAPLLKSFQAEVDNLTKRSKFAETAFLTVYKNIIEITDPVPSLEYCLGIEKKLGKYADIEIENKNLREALEGYKDQFKEIRNQEATIQSLNEKLKEYETDFNESMSSKLKTLEKDLHSQYLEKERLLQETQNSVMRRLQEAEARTVTLQLTLEETQSELFEYKNKSEETSSALQEETNMLANDLERANHRAALAEKEVTRLEEQLAKSENDRQSSAAQIDASAELLARSSLEVELAVKDKEIVQLVEDIKSLQASVDKSRDETTRKFALFENQLDEKNEQVDMLEQQLAKQKDYQEIKRELAIIKSVEFGSSSDDTNKQMLDETSQGKPLEMLLMEKNKSLQNENTVMKQANLDLTKHITESNQEVSNLRALSAEQKNLIAQLESDLTSMQSFSSLYRGEGEGCPSMPEMVAEAVKSSTMSAEGELQEIITTDGKKASGDGQSVTMSENTSLSGSVGDPVTLSPAESLLPIVSAQRERFKLRNEELESELTSKGQQMSVLQNEVDTLRSDNVKLYEKIRFLQSYRNERSGTSSLAESRYSQPYEESLDPFASFSRKEKMRKYSALSPFEKVTLALGRFILSNKTARTVTFIYTALLHILVFLVLYKIAHIESCKRDFASDCAARFAEHMHEVHGDENFKG